MISAEFVRNEDRPGSTPDQLRAGSQQRCCWQCAHCQHEWVSTVANRTNGRGCPVCVNKRRAAARRVVAPGLPSYAARSSGAPLNAGRSWTGSSTQPAATDSTRCTNSPSAPDFARANSLASTGKTSTSA
ncbi:zinc-ribbon domain-containing protein [Streptomyces sp. NPDC046182]|uniref:zinc-ribbon domain-containing protein n=1 Tax=Streptomyces sp. NPDC046182 TaxID=3154601 RepID=UPI0033F1DA10